MNLDQQNWIILLANFVLSQRTEACAKLRKKTAANYRTRLLAKRQLSEICVSDWKPLKPFALLPPYTQQKAWRVRIVLDAYRLSVEKMNLISQEACLVARALYLLLTGGETVTDSTIRRWLRREDSRGGPDFSRIEAYADRLSVPHHRNSAPKNASQ